MAFVIEALHAPASEVRRVLHGCLDGVDSALGDVDSDVDRAVHEARKRLKKARATIRLVRPVMGKAFQRENRSFRDAGRLLAPFRDAWVRFALVRKLAEEEEGEDVEEALAILAARLGAEHDEATDPVVVGAAVAEVVDLLSEARRRIDEWPVEKWRIEEVPIDEPPGFPLFRDGVIKVHQRARRGYESSKSRPSVEAFHEWRKRTKDLRYQVELLNTIWPSVLGAFEHTLHELTDLLGDDHDLAVLHEALEGSEDLGLTVPQRRALDERLLTRRDALQEAFWPLGERLFQEDSEQFAWRLEACWNDCAWR